MKKLNFFNSVPTCDLYWICTGGAVAQWRSPSVRPYLPEGRWFPR